jgi:hypothetical protein
MASDYPRWLYARDGRAQIVQDEDEEAALGSDFSSEPSDIHRGGAPGVPEMPLPHGQDALINDIATRVADRVFERISELVRPSDKPSDNASRERKRA